MPADPLAHYGPGDEWVPQAATLNAWTDAARLARGRNAAKGSPFDTSFSNWQILVRNDTGAELDRYDVVEITDPIFAPAENQDEWGNLIVFQSVAPAGTPTTRPTLGIVQKPAVENAYVPAVIAGMTFARVLDATGVAVMAGIDDTQPTTRLKAEINGPVQVLWRRAGGDDTREAIVLLQNRPHWAYVEGDLVTDITVGGAANVSLDAAINGVSEIEANASWFDETAGRRVGVVWYESLQQWVVIAKLC
jgi:hypothetical protein